ncbi:MAG: hypothetical protein VR75_03070 [Hyphomonadaceae bacterium BRH_c29]|nr:MAG: hypothetical protein VR75_03070 [Hyphomonadaceae bacterium BRH_c29]
MPDFDIRMSLDGLPMENVDVMVVYRSDVRGLDLRKIDGQLVQKTDSVPEGQVGGLVMPCHLESGQCTIRPSRKVKWGHRGVLPQSAEIYLVGKALDGHGSAKVGVARWEGMANPASVQMNCDVKTPAEDASEWQWTVCDVDSPGIRKTSTAQTD